MSFLSSVNIEINRKPLKSFQSISISQSLYCTDSFRISCRYDSIERMDGFLIENAKDYLGLPIVIKTKVKVKDDETDGIFFKGFVTAIQGARTGMDDNDEAVISGGSSEIALNRKPTNRAFLDKTLEEIVAEVLSKYQFKTNVSTRNKQKFPYIVQFEESDLDFLRRLSVRFGEWFFYNGQEVVFGELPIIEKTLTLGHDLNDFRYNLRVNPVKFSLFSLDPLKLEVYRFQSGNGKAEANLNLYGKHALNRSNSLYAEEGRDYYEHLNVEESEYKKGLDMVGTIEETADIVNLTDVSGSSTNGSLMAGVRVNVNCPQQQAKGNLNYGKYLVTSVQHSIDSGLTYRNNFSAIPAETTIPENADPYYIRHTDNQLGMIADNEDPKQLGRVKVSFWWMEGKQSTPWIKMTTPLANKNSGFYFVPAVKSRALVGFEDGDVEKPYCIGSLFDEDANPDSEWTGNYDRSNAKIHAIRTKSGQTVEFHDEKGSEKIRIYDSLNGKFDLVFDPCNEEVQIKAAKKITLEAGEIEIKATNGLKIDGGQKIEERATTIKTDAQSSFEAKSINVQLTGSVSFKAEGQTSAELSSGGMTTVKGGIVKIN